MSYFFKNDLLFQKMSYLYKKYLTFSKIVLLFHKCLTFSKNVLLFQKNILLFQKCFTFFNNVLLFQKMFYLLEKYHVLSKCFILSHLLLTLSYFIMHWFVSLSSVYDLIFLSPNFFAYIWQIKLMGTVTYTKYIYKHEVLFS